MKISFTIGADFREMQGKGASRRLRHTGKVPAILYGGHKEPRALMLDQQNLLTMIEDERFYSSIVQLKITESGQTQEAIIKDVQMHPARHSVVHVDLLRVVPNEKIRIRLPIHFKRHRVSSPVGRGSVLPAAGLAGVPRDGSLGHEPERDPVPRGPAGAEWRDAH
jgi:large subunit ribosomal protein L25